MYTPVDPFLYTHFSAAGKAYPVSNNPFPVDVVEVPYITGCTNDNKQLQKLCTG